MLVRGKGWPWCEGRGWARHRSASWRSAALASGVAKDSKWPLTMIAARPAGTYRATGFPFYGPLRGSRQNDHCPRKVRQPVSLQAVLLPLIVQVALTFALLLWLAPLRGKALRSKEVHPRDIALDRSAWPMRARQVANCFSNQFELPMLFYPLVILAIIARKADILFVILSWLFVATRLVHAFIHTGSNIVSLRGAAYGAGMVVLLVMWIIFTVRLVAAY
jgi:hypothetical protein